MKLFSSRLGLGLAGLTLAALPATADTIFLLDGSSLDDVTVSGETFKEVEYKDGSKKTVKTDDVLRIEFSAKSQLVERADLAADEGQLFDAISDLTTYVDGQIASGKKPRYSWEPAYAMHRLIELNSMVGDAEGLIAAADKLIANAPESRFAPEAFLAKAETQFLTGNAAGANKTLKDFLAVIQGKQLSQRWSIEHKLASALYDTSLKGSKLRDALANISKEAGGAFPLVKNAAEVAIGESLIESQKLTEAEPIFQRITDDSKASEATLAAAYTGLGDCLFKRATQTAAGEQRDKLMRDAKMAYMRVVVVYKDQVRYVPKAMFWAGRVFDESTDELDKEKAQKLYAKVAREYQGTKWGDEAKGFRRR
jgi:tetratricopeptide (TPR) repeat protein